MITTPVQTRSPKPRPEILFPAWWIVALIVVANSALCFATLHVFHGPAYRSAGRMPDLLLWALAVDVLTGGLAALFGLRFGWRRLRTALTLQLFISLLPLMMVRALRISSPDSRTHIVGIVYALFIYMHASVLLVYGFSNAAHSRPPGSKVALHVWVFAVSLLIYGAITPWMDMACLPTADEPHYLLLTHSLVFDHDFDLANNYAHGDYRNYYPVNIPRSDHHSVSNARGQEFPVHDVGISILAVPGYALGGRLGAMLELNFFGALLALGIFALGVELKANPRAALAAWALFAFTSPMAMYTSQIYPEIVGAGLITWALVAYIRFTETREWSYLWLAASAIALLPWFSIRYWVIIGPLLAGMLLQLLVAGNVHRVPIFRAFAVIFAPLLVSVGSFAFFDFYLYGVPVPNAGYVLLLRPRPSLLTPHLLPGLPGLLFDRAFGLLTTAPVYLLAIAGAWVLCRRRPWQGLIVVLPVLAYFLLAALNRFWYGGWAPPPRYIVTGVAILTPLAAVVLSRGTPRWLVAAMAGWSFFIAVAYTAFPLTRYTYWNVNTGALSDFLAPVLGFHFGVVFPSFIRAGRRDYLLCLIWAALALAAICLLVRRASAGEELDESCLPERP